MTRVMYFDCFSGAAGDMTLGALIDAGLPVDALRHALGSLGVDHELRITRVLRAGLSATRVEVIERTAGASPTHPSHLTHAHPSHLTHAHPSHLAHAHPTDPAHPTHPSHAHPSHPTHPTNHDDHPHHRSLQEIIHLIYHSKLSPAGKARAAEMFRRLAEVEAAIHQMDVEDVHLHEVGALDSIIDIVGIVFAMEWFGIDDVVVSPMNVGSGSVMIAHGRFPVPAPATLRLLGHVPMFSEGPAVELTTPTGALVMSTYGKAFGPPPPMTVDRIGYGAGTRDFPGIPNVLRVMVGTRLPSAEVASTPVRSAPHASSEDGDVVEITCQIDDMNPQWFGPAMEQLLADGALDVYLTPVIMKKGRPGTLVTMLAPAQVREALCDRLFRETTTIGLRWHPVERETLERRWVDVPVEGGVIRIKVASRRGEFLNATPEFEDCLRVARATGRPLKTVHGDALDAWARHRQESSR